jgi:SnoaL-like domain
VQRKVAPARQFVEAVTAHDFEAAEAFLDPGVETVTPRGTLRGIAACRQVLQKANGDGDAIHDGTSGAGVRGC